MTKNTKSTGTHLGDTVPQGVCLCVRGRGRWGGWGFLSRCAPRGLGCTWVEHIALLLVAHTFLSLPPSLIHSSNLGIRSLIQVLDRLWGGSHGTGRVRRGLMSGPWFLPWGAQLHLPAALGDKCSRCLHFLSLLPPKHHVWSLLPLK